MRILILTRMKIELFVQFVASFIQTMVDFGLGAMDVMTGLTDVKKMCITVKNVECEHF